MRVAWQLARYHEGLRLCHLVRLLFLLQLSVGVFAQSASPAPWPDLDHDGIPDALEQQLLERFLPRFHISGDECDGMPATFAPGELTPRPLERDGAIYGQATPVATETGSLIALRYFHLWAQDCGRLSHPLDVEHVAVLIQRQPGRTTDGATNPYQLPQEPWAWKALYWFAAGHQNTICDTSHGASATALVAEWIGADVWISAGKHASYLARSRCRAGCGGDQCNNMRPLPVSALHNLGEPGHPLGGADWIASDAWPLAEKMGPAFPAHLLTQLATAPSNRIFAVNTALPPVRATVRAGGEVLDGAGTGARHTGRALQKGKSSSGSAIGRSMRAVGRALGLSQESSEPESSSAETSKPDAVPDRR
jgi:hypothetical protein